MAYTQVKSFDKTKAGSKPGYCLQNTRLGYGIAAKYSNAITAWRNTQQHKNRSIPSGVAVPLYYSYKLDGHINVQLPDGKVWSDGAIYANLKTYEDLHPAVTYLGWGESVNDVRVIKESNMPTLTTKSDLDFLYKTDLGRTRRGGEGEDVYLGKDYKFVDQDLWNSSEARSRRSAAEKEVSNLKASVASLTKEVAALKTQATTNTPVTDGFNASDRATLNWIKALLQKIFK